MSMFLMLVAFGLLAVAMVGTPLLLVHVAAEWWFSREEKADEEWHRCLACSAPYHSSWDPADFTEARARADRSWMSGGLCPECSGAS